MMKNALANQQALGSRAGHGWDSVGALNDDGYYGQKGGSLNSSGNVFQINGEWGFAACWGGLADAPGHSWYPNFPEVMNVAKVALAKAPDLFPQFGMPSL